MSIFDYAAMSRLGFTGGGTPAVRPPQPKSKILELLEALQGEQDAPIPSSFRELPEEDRRRQRNQTLLSIGAALSDHQPGQLGSALLQAAMSQNAGQQDALQAYQQRVRQERADKRASIARQLDVEQARQAEDQRLKQEELHEHERGRLGALAEAIRQQLDPDDPRGVEADALAASGDQAGMAKLLGNIREDRQKRALAAKYGVDPEDPQALKTAQEIAQQQELQKRGLGPYYRAPEKPHEGSLQVGEDGYYHLIDQITGRSTRTEVRAPAKEGGEHISRDDKERNEDLETATQHAQWKRAQLYDTYQSQLADESRWPQGPNGEPIRPQPPQMDFAADVKARFDQLQRVRRATRPARLVSPVGGSDPSGAPTSATGPGKGKPQESKATADDVIRLLPKGMVLDPAAKSAIEEALRSGKTAAQIRTEILRDNGML